MDFSLNNVLSLLHNYRGRPYISGEDKRTYRWACLLPDNHAEMSQDILYVCRLSEAMLHNHLAPECHFVCIADRYLSDEERDDFELLKNIIVIEENRSLSWLLNLIQGRFRELEEWEQKMKDAVLSGCSYQTIFDISEMYFKNSLFALDSAYRLIACSKTYRSSDPMNIDLYEKGYYTQEYLQKFYQKRRFSDYSSSPGITINKPGVVARFESYAQWCRHDNNELVQIVLVFSSNPAMLESPELFQLMMKYINIVFEKELKSSTSTQFSYTRLMRDMLYKGLNDLNQIHESAKQLGIPIYGNFDVFSIQFTDRNNVLPGRFITDILTLLPEARAISYESKVTVLNSYRSSNSENSSDEILQKLEPMLLQHGAFCGVSSRFSSFSDLHLANLQAENAITYTLKLNQLSDKRIFHYHDIILYHIIDSAASVQYDAFHNNPFTEKINTLIYYDKDNGTDLFHILYTYLYYERRATETANALHMHRNTVMYHIQHITDLIKLDLNDYHTRQGLILAYHFKMIKG